MTTGIIYIAFSQTTGKSYIGQTIKKLSKRKSEHRRKSITNTNKNCKFYNYINKYGFDDFTWKILFYSIPIKKLNLEEICAIYLYDTYYTGLNSTFGGEGAKGKKLSKETKKKISIANTGKRRGPMSDETKKKISIANTGKKRTEETKSKLKKYRLGKKHSNKTKKKISIANSGENNSMFGKNHSEETKINIGNIHKNNTYWIGRKHSKITKTKMKNTWQTSLKQGKRRGDNASRSKLNSKQVLDIRYIYKNENISSRELAKKYGVSKTQILRIIKNESWK